MKYKLNSGKIISGHIKCITFLDVKIQRHPISIIMQLWNREMRDAYTKAMHTGYFIQIRLSTSSRMFSQTHYDWCDKQIEVAEWINSHKI